MLVNHTAAKLRRGRLQLPYYCSKCDIHQPFCSGCYRPLGSFHHSKKLPISEDSDAALPGSLAQKRKAWKANVLRCIGCEQKQASDKGLAGPERYTTCGETWCHHCQHAMRLSVEQRDVCARNSWSKMCARCVRYCQREDFQNVLRLKGAGAWFVISSVQEFEAMYHTECDFCRAVANAVEVVFPRFEGHKVLIIGLETGEMGFGAYLYRAEDRIQVFAPGTGNGLRGSIGELDYLTDFFVCTPSGE